MRVDRAKLIYKMAQANISVNGLAYKSGISRVTISAIRNGKSCTKKTAERIAEALNVPIDELMRNVTTL